MNPNRRAFSLIEVTLVILLLGIIAAVSTPRFASTLRVMRMKAAAQQLAAHVEYIRRVAANEGRSTTLVCDNTLSTYSSNVDFPERIGETISVSIAETFDESISLVADFDSQTSMTFDYEGTPHVGGVPLVNGTVTLSAGSDAIVVSRLLSTSTTTTSKASCPSPGLS